MLVIIAQVDVLGILMTVVGLGGLIFFHELGHFLACRVTGTRVEAFSVGFGKEIFGWTRKGTRYRIGIVPLGGYVKMAAENPGQPRTGAPDEFPNKSFSQRLLIMSSGVLFNMILAFLLFAWAFGIGVPFQKPEIGAVAPGSAAMKAGLQPGDVVTHIDGRAVLNFPDLKMEVAFAAGDELRFAVERGGRTLELPVVPQYSETLGHAEIGIEPTFKPEAEDVATGSPAARAGGRAGDRVLSVAGRPVGGLRDAIYECYRLAGEAEGEAKALDVTLRVRRDGGGEEELHVSLPLLDRPQIGIIPFEGAVVRSVARALAGTVKPGDRVLRVNGEAVEDLGLLRDVAGDEPVAELAVRRGEEEIRVDLPAGTTVKELANGVAGDLGRETTAVAPRRGMPAERAGILAGDRVVTAAGRPISSYAELQTAIVDHGTAPLPLEIERGEGRATVVIVPGRWPDELGYKLAEVMTTYRETGLLSSISMGWRRTTLSVRTVVFTIRSLVTARVSHKNIGGPITLARVTYVMFDQGWGHYLYILALISVNLAILNILPIPVLDGGQIVLLCAEKLRGRPLPDRIVGYYQLVGLVLILGLLILAFKNDLTGLLE